MPADALDLASSLHELDEATRSDRRLDTALLDAELPDRRFVDEEYLHWLYDTNPLGAAFEGHVDDDGVRVAHYALIPQRYRNRDRTAPFVFSLNAVTRSGGQRKGYFSGLCRELWGRAAAAGVEVIVGVTNSRSLRPVVRLGWRCVGPLPVAVLLPRPRRPRGWESFAVDPHFLAGATFAELAEGLDRTPAESWTNSATPGYLRWRLRSPNGGGFAVHADERLVVVSTVEHRAGMAIAVICKLLPRDGRFGPLDVREAVTEVCRFHRAPAAVYAGWNRHVPVRGIPLPERLKPAPLYLMVHSLVPEINQATLTLDTYEFLDADAY